MSKNFVEDRVAVDWMTRLHREIFFIGKTKTLFSGAKLCGSGAMTTYMRNDGKLLYVLETCAHNLVSWKAGTPIYAKKVLFNLN